MHEAACFVRKIFVLGMLESCKCFWGMGLKNVKEFGGSRIVPTGFVRNRVEVGSCDLSS